MCIRAAAKRDALMYEEGKKGYREKNGAARKKQAPHTFYPTQQRPFRRHLSTHLRWMRVLAKHTYVKIRLTRGKSAEREMNHTHIVSSTHERAASQMGLALCLAETTTRGTLLLGRCTLCNSFFFYLQTDTLSRMYV